MAHHTLIGLDIGSRSLKLAQLVWEGERLCPRVLRQHVWNDGVGDEAAFDDAFTSALKSMVAESGIRGKRVVITAPATLVDVRPMTAPLTEGVDLMSYVQAEISERTAQLAREFVADYWIAGETVEHGETKLEVYSVSAPRQEMVQLIKAVERAGLVCMRVEVAVIALARCVRWASAGDQTSSRLILDIGDSSSQLLALGENGIDFCRMIKWGGRDVTTNIQKTLAVDVETAERIKTTWGISPISRDPTSDGPTSHPQQQRVNDSIEQELRALALEIGRSLAYRARCTSDCDVTVLGIAGGGALLKGLPGFIKDALKLSVEQTPVLASDAPACEVSDKESIASYGSAVGAALAGVTS